MGNPSSGSFVERNWGSSLGFYHLLAFHTWNDVTVKEGKSGNVEARNSFLLMSNQVVKIIHHPNTVKILSLGEEIKTDMLIPVWHSSHLTAFCLRAGRACLTHGVSCGSCTVFSLWLFSLFFIIFFLNMQHDQQWEKLYFQMSLIQQNGWCLAFLNHNAHPVPLVAYSFETWKRFPCPAVHRLGWVLYVPLNTCGGDFLYFHAFHAR